VTSKNEASAKTAREYLMNNYGPRSITLVRGKGSRVWDADGREYIDFVAGIATCNLGHCHPRVTKAIQDQAAKLVHVSNLYHIQPQIELGKKLCENSFASKVFFCNSGTEANEAAIKLARKYQKDHGRPERYEVVSLENSFHGRTLGSITATGQPKYHKGFEPLPEGFRYTPLNDSEALERAVDGKTAAVLIEPVQGEGGIRPCSEGFLRKAREICDRDDVLLIFDEVQSGMGRIGSLFGYQQYDVEPDGMTLAKALGNGVPIGAFLVSEKCGEILGPGTHAATFGGNPLSSSAAIATLDTLLEEGLPARAGKVGHGFKASLQEIAKGKNTVRDVRGRGLMVGVELDVEAKPLSLVLAEKGFLAVPAGSNVLRFVPALNIPEADLQRMLEVLEDVLQ
jgi:predicted acetylornithine/succinylornithine family transaminase